VGNGPPYKIMNDKEALNLFSSGTIAAVATAPGVGAVGIVRLSGPEALAIARRCFLSKRGGDPLEDRRLTFGQWVEPESGEALDDVLVVAMRGPHSYTGEDVVEVHGHGGPLVLGRILSAAVSAGARLAGPGEFTLRAFRNGRLDLLQAEAVADLIGAQTDSARRLALRSLRGGLSQTVARMKEEVIELLANLETHLEFPLEDAAPLPPAELLQRLAALRGEVKRLLEMASRSRLYRRGIFTVLTGKPNTGKSLLFNRLLGRGRALVTPHPGTTRDTLEETVSIQGLELLLVDTAGGRETGEEIERLGIERTAEAAAQADMIWFLTDAQTGVTDEDETWLKRIREISRPASIPFFLLQNKADLMERIPPLLSPQFLEVFPAERRLEVSAQTGRGLDRLIEAVKRVFLGEGRIQEESDLLVQERHRRTLEELLETFARIDFAVEAGLSLDCVAIDLWTIKNGLDRLDGTQSSNDLLGEIFSRFCIGK
jgi:tRNA modification GTPase